MEMQNERTHGYGPDGSEGEEDGGVGAADRDAMARLLAAGDAIIAQSLSHDSHAFLESNRQQGGE